MSPKAPRESPLLSLIIPTRERVETLAYTLSTALRQASTDYEILVSDNASTDGTAALVQSLTDSRVRYLNTGRRLSMCDNYEFAVEHSRGRYVLIIGDDDAILPAGLDYLLERLRRQSDATVHMWPLHVYDWPAGDEKARLSYLAPQGSERVLTLKDKARWVVQMGGWKYYDLPSPYHCATPRWILDALRSRTGRIFHSTQPDVFTAMAIPVFADQAINVGKTVTMNGRSARSNGRGFITQTAHSNIDRFIQEYGNYRFHPTLSAAVSARANMIPDAILIAKDMFPGLYGDVEFGYEAMLAYVCRVRFESHLEILQKAAVIRKSHPLRIGTFLKYSAVHELAVLRRQMLNSLALSRNINKDVPDNISDFVDYLGKITSSPLFAS